MTLIPSDVGVRMRLQLDQTLLPVTPVTELPTDLTDLTQGKLFSARIEEVLPDNTYKALVAGRSLTLALPEGAKAGDTLELVVVRQTPRAIVAQLANPESLETDPTAGQFTKLSPSAQLIGSLLARAGETPASAPLTRGQPLISHAPSRAADILPKLAQAISRSGMFYESHQVQWVMGQKTLSELLMEPQAVHSNPDTLAAYQVDTNVSTPLQPKPPRIEIGAETLEIPMAPESQQSGPKRREPTATNSIFQSLFDPDGRDLAKQGVAPSVASTASAIPDDLRPLLQQQLEAAATQRMAWHGEVWPDQKLEWEIEKDQKGQNSATDEPTAWVTSLRLTTPRLGDINARLRLTSGGVQITITTPYGSTAGDLRGAGPELQRALDAAGVPLLSLKVKHDGRS